MQVMALFGVVVFGVLSLVVGLRLLLLARSTRQLPEFLIGFSFLSGGVLGHLPEEVAPMVHYLPETLRVGLHMGGRFMAVLCCVSIALMAWRVFQRQETWAPGLFLALLAMFAVNCATDVFVTRPGDFRHDAFGTLIGTLARTAAFVWTAWAALHYHAMLRRRMRLGLADPVVANRIFLWGVAAALFALSHPLSSVSQFLTGGMESHPAVPLIQSAIGLVVAVCVTLAFFPPHAYLQWIASRAAPQES